MSLILDALKRSEAERRKVRNEPPPVESGERRTDDRRQRQGWIVLGAVVVAVGLGVGSAWWRAPGENARPAAGPATGANSPPSTAAVPAGLSTSSPARRERKQEPEERQSDRVPIAVGEGGEKVRPRATIEHMPATATVGDTVPDEMAELDALPPAPEGVPLAEPPASPRPTRGTETAPVDFVRLPYQTRQAVGSLRLDVHVFDADPARRFVMINGKTLGVGEEIKPGLTVDEIVREGVVLTWEGHPFLLGTGD